MVISHRCIRMTLCIIPVNYTKIWTYPTLPPSIMNCILFCRNVYELLFIVCLLMNYCLLYFYLWIIVIVYSLSFSLYYLWILSNVYWKPFYLWKWEISLITGNEENIKTTIASLTWVFHPGSAWDSGTQPIF